MECFSNNGQIRKRGRPAGKSRQPLNKEEKKLRNAQYERERRGVIAKATSELADAVGVDQSVSVSALLNTALKQIRKGSQNPPQSIDVLRNRNQDLLGEIKDLERFLSKKEKENAIKTVGKTNTDKQEKHGIKRKYGKYLKQEEEPSTRVNEQDQQNQDILLDSEFIIPSEFDTDIELSDICVTWFN